MKENYNNLFKNEVANFDKKHSILLHSCCAPCSSHVISVLKDYFDITILYYNPNISPIQEYEKRKQEQINFIKQLDCGIKIMDCDYDNDVYEKCIKGLENEKEGGARCLKCFRLRLEKTAKLASVNNFDYFCTTLTVSPYKNSQVINSIGKELMDIYNVKWLYSDFKKEEGYKHSIALSKQYNLYRQDYCGCIYSIRNKIDD